MEEELIRYYSQFTTLSEEDVQIIKTHHEVRSYPRNTDLLKQGQLARECYLVLKGCVKSYYLKDGEEQITEFYMEGDPITPVSYTQQQPSEYYLTSIESCVVSIGSPERTQAFLQQYPRYAELFYTISNELMAQNRISFDSYRLLPPEERYQELLSNRPELIQRVPQYMIASYLGIKPESLSRIRRRMSSQ